MRTAFITAGGLVPWAAVAGISGKDRPAAATITTAFVVPRVAASWLSQAICVAVTLVRLVPDRRIERGMEG